ncbi:hypothetical protein Rain11_0773 [Raineya orbicola]|uniref:Uncharacterized protein n=1 Tax=Raineya orbicola TaxID=2016530 RepID=A0A2N3IIT8_9BACT|nr:hypothetical protein Rain11_0773 [Raineya orbicola]
MYLHQKNSLTLKEIDKVFLIADKYSTTNEAFIILLKAVFESNPEYALPQIKSFLKSKKLRDIDADIVEFFYKLVVHYEQKGDKHILQEILSLFEQKIQEVNDDFCLNFVSFEPKTQKRFLYIKKKLQVDTL